MIEGTSPYAEQMLVLAAIVMLANHREIWTCTRGIHGNEWTRNASPSRGKSFTTVTDRDIRGVVKWAITHIPE